MPWSVWGLVSSGFDPNVPPILALIWLAISGECAEGTEGGKVTDLPGADGDWTHRAT